MNCVVYDRLMADYEKIRVEISGSAEGKLALNLGCGPKMVWENWINIDAFTVHPGVLRADLVNPGYLPGTVDLIHSSHSLEHVPMHEGLRAFENWSVLLKPGGILHLAVPDLENICRLLLSPDIGEDHKWNWYIYTLYGYQIDPEIMPNERVQRRDLKTDYGQIHFTSFSKARLQSLAQKFGFEVADLFSYDGFGTPSLYMKAIKRL